MTYPHEQEFPADPPVHGYFAAVCDYRPEQEKYIACTGWRVPYLSYLPGSPVIGGQQVQDRLRNKNQHVQVAEYHAAIQCLLEIYRAGWREEVILCTHSTLVPRQYARKWMCHHDYLLELRARLDKAAQVFKKLDIILIAREENQQAMQIARDVFFEITGGRVPIDYYGRRDRDRNRSNKSL
jgi:hypothetical protein